MTRVRDIFSSTFLRGEDLNGKPLTVTVDGFGTEMAWGDEHYVLYLAGQQKSLKLTGALGTDIAAINGGNDEIEAFVGLTIQLYPEPRTIKDRKTGEDKDIVMIRARAVPGAAAPKAPPSKPPKSGPPLVDDIPY